jgi:hypothetical protein
VSKNGHVHPSFAFSVAVLQGVYNGLKGSRFGGETEAGSANWRLLGQTCQSPEDPLH